MSAAWPTQVLACTGLDVLAELKGRERYWSWRLVCWLTRLRCLPTAVRWAVTWTAWSARWMRPGPTLRSRASGQMRSDTAGWCRTPGWWPARRPSRTGQPGSPGSRAACRWWRSRSRRTSSTRPHYSMPLRPNTPGRGHHPRPDVLHRAGRAQPGHRDLLQGGHPHLSPARNPAHRPVEGDQGRAGPGPGRRPDQDRRGLPRRRSRPVPPARRAAAAPGVGPARPARQAATSPTSARSSRARTCPP